jgi:Cys-rich repeat protein
MNKRLSSVGFVIAVAMAALFAGSLLPGCQLYFGDHSNGTGSASSPGPGGSSGSGSSGPGFPCSGDAQCAAGCFCADGTCAEAGFCRSDKDCGTGFVCDTARSSCKPAPTCTTSDQCAPGSECDGTTCVATCACTSDADAIRQGFGWCDETRNTCMIGSDPAGACLGEITCATDPPACPEGQVALRKDGCYTGQCRAITACEAAPACLALQHEDDCNARSPDCAPFFTGHNCTGICDGSDPAACHCESYSFSYCQDSSASSPGLTVGN